MNDVWSTLSQRVHERIGSPLPEQPDAADPQFLRLLSELRRADALLAEEVINAFTGTDQRLPSEQEAEVERRRQNVRTRLFARFFRPDGLRTGRVRFNLRKTVHWVGALVAIVIVVWSAIPKSGDVSPTPPRAQATASNPARGSIAAPAPGADRTDGTRLSMQPPIPPQATPPPLPQMPLPVMPPGDFSPPAEAFPTGAPYPGVTPPDPVATKVIVFEASAAAADASPVVYERTTAGQPAGVPPQAASVSGDLVGLPQGSAAAVIVYDAQAARAPTITPPPGTSSGTTADSSAQAPRSGQLLEAALVTPVTVSSAGTPTPALVEITAGPLQGAVMFGQAMRTADGLIGMQFTKLITKSGQEQPFNAVAYDAAVGRTGIAGQVSTMMPGAASAVAAATIQAASDYFTARAKQQQVTVTNGFLTITQGTPAFWDSLVATLAKAFTPTTSSTAGPTVVTRLERGRTITVMVM